MLEGIRLLPHLKYDCVYVRPYHFIDGLDYYCLMNYVMRENDKKLCIIICAYTLNGLNKLGLDELKGMFEIRANTTFISK